MTEFFEIFEILIGGMVWVGVIGTIVWFFIRNAANRPKRGPHPTTINKTSAPPKKQGKVFRGPTVSSDGHRIPKSKDVTCEGQYGHDHENTGPRFIVHEEPTTGYCNLNGKIVALKDCWKY